MSISGNLLRTDKPAAGVPCELTWDGDLLRLSSNDEQQHLSCDDMTVALEGFDQDQVVLRWPDQAPPIALSLPAQALRNANLAGAPDALVDALGQLAARSQHFHRRFKTLAIVATTIIGIPLLILTLFFTGNQSATRLVMSQVPEAWDVAMGEVGLESIKQEYELRQSGQDYTALQRILQRLNTDLRFEPKLHVSDSDEVNAFALPGGPIVVHQGLIQQTETPEELAAVLAHELQHVEARHGTQMMMKHLGIGALWVLLTGDAVSLMAIAATEVLSLTFSRAIETEADERAVAQLMKHDIDPSGMVTFFERLAAQQKVALPGFLSSHPHSGDRSAHILTLIPDPEPSWRPLEVGVPWPPTP